MILILNLILNLNRLSAAQEAAARDEEVVAGVVDTGGYNGQDIEGRECEREQEGCDVRLSNVAVGIQEHRLRVEEGLVQHAVANLDSAKRGDVDVRRCADFWRRLWVEGWVGVEVCAADQGGAAFRGARAAQGQAAELSAGNECVVAQCVASEAEPAGAAALVAGVVSLRYELQFDLI